jgi:N-acyl homoserine lactone hydrolase
MLAGRVDGVSPDERTASATLTAIRSFSQAYPTVYLPTHDPQSATRLANRRLVGTPDRAAPQVVDLGRGKRSRAMVG